MPELFPQFEELRLMRGDLLEDSSMKLEELRLMRENLLEDSSVKLEAAAGAQSLDEPGWMRVGEANTTLPSYTRDKAVTASENLFYSSPLAHRCIEQVTDFVVGEGFELTSGDQQAADILHQFWHSPVNVLPSNLYAMVQEFFLYGELCFIKKVHNDGFVALTFVPPREIESVRPREGLPGIPGKVILTTGDEFDVISWDSVNGKLAGDCFFFRMQHLGSDVRGFPRLLPMVDFLRAWESFTYNYLKKRALWDAIWWEVKLEGFNQDQIDDWLSSKQARPPQPGSIFAHNERVDWKLTQADFKSSAFDRDGTFFLDFLLGSAGLADFAHAPTSRARDRGEVLDPIARGLSTRQFEIRTCFSFIGSYVLQEAISHGGLEDKLYEVLCQAPRLGVRDFQRSSGSLLRFVNALGQAEDNDWLDSKESSIIFRDMLVRLGLLDRALPPQGDKDQKEELDAD